jgi:flagellar basal-body rod protein FlgF
METTAYIALSRQLGLARHVEVVANNIANATTTGFKAEALRFEAVMVRALPGERLAFVQEVGLMRDLAPGPMTPTGNPFDFAVEGPGFFAVETEAGVRYTRAGQFRPNDAGELVTASGHTVLDEGGAPLLLPEGGGPPSVARDGTLSNEAGPFGRLQLVEFASPRLLQREADGLFAAQEEPLPAEGSKVVQGMLEGSNVQAIHELTRMMEAVRAFQGAQRMIEAHHEGKRRAIETMLKTGA